MDPIDLYREVAVRLVANLVNRQILEEFDFSKSGPGGITELNIGESGDELGMYIAGDVPNSG